MAEEAMDIEPIRNVTGTAASRVQQGVTLLEARKREEAHSNNLAMLIGVPGERGRQIMREGRAAFDPMYNAGERNNGKLTVGTEAN